MNTDDLILKLENMADRKTRYHYGVGDYWNALGDAADALRELQNLTKEGAVDNQHRQIKGYRELNPNEIAKMNEVKEMGIKLGGLVESLRNDTSLDQRWVSIGATELQQGLMALTRSIAKPEFF
jgi:hypothetical protein